MDENTVTFFVIVGLIFVDVWILLWFLVSHGAVLHPSNRNKLVCLSLESIYFVYFVGRSWSAPREDFFELFAPFCFCSFFGMVLEMVVTFITNGRFGLSFIKESTIDPKLHSYLSLWEKMYSNWFIVSAAFSFVVLSFLLWKCRHDYLERAEDQRGSEQMARNFGITRYDTSSTQKHCAICLSEYKQDEEVAECACKHIFHNECITEWLRTKQTCPLCRHNVYEQADHAIGVS